MQERSDASDGGGGRLGEGQNAVVAMLLAMSNGLLYPVLFHEVTSFLSRIDTEPRETVYVVAPLASAVLLQPKCKLHWSDESHFF